MSRYRDNSPDGAGAHLLSHISDDSNTPTPDSFSDYHVDIVDAYPSKSRSSRSIRIRRTLSSLTHSPLGLRTRRKSHGIRYRACVSIFNLVALSSVLVITLSILEGILRPSYSSPPQHYLDLAEKVRQPGTPGRGNVRGEKIFIASNIIQDELIRGAWGASVLNLINYLGPDNVFVSIYENDSGPESVQALTWFRDQLECKYSITTGDHLPIEEFPTVILPHGEPRVKRITYLTEVRNRLLRPLNEPPKLKEGQIYNVNHTNTRFDRILFLNDIYFRPEDALNLLFSTNLNKQTGMPEYQGACALDFIRGGTLYDSFVIRDMDGYEITSFLYPWFTARGSGESREDVLAQKDAVRVRSCWSGMAAYEATPFLRKEVVDASPHPAHLAMPELLVNNASRTAGHFSKHLILRQDYTPLRFRSQSDLFWEASECCLLNADLLTRYPGIGTQMFVNPFVRVAYDADTWKWQPWFQRVERGFYAITRAVDILALDAEVNPRRTQVVGRPTTVRKWVYDMDQYNGEKMRGYPTADQLFGDSPPLSQDQVTGGWKTVEEIAQPGGFCGQRRLFVMLSDVQKANRGKSGKNWEKISVPKD